MNKQFRIVLAGVLVALASVIGFQVIRTSRDRQPVYVGKSLSLWLRTYAPASSSRLHSSDLSVFASAPEQVSGAPGPEVGRIADS